MVSKHFVCVGSNPRGFEGECKIPWVYGNYVMMDGREVQFSRAWNADLLTVPQSFYDRQRLLECLDFLEGSSPDDALEFAVEDVADAIRVRLTARRVGSDPDDAWAQLFARLHGYPDYGHVEVGDFRNAEQPLLSCVILLTANDRFVARHLIPSIVANSASFPVEILVVYNGVGLNLGGLGDLPVIRSDFGWVSRGYNAGVREARGRYVALFHDDCVVCSPRWIEESITMLEDGHAAVTPELQGKPTGLGGEFVLAKNVPLVMRRQDFLDLGGYDEFHYAGYEDQDFTYDLLSRGMSIGRLDLPYLHFDGMSTVALLSRAPELFGTLFGFNALAHDTIHDLRNEVLGRLRDRPQIMLTAIRDTDYIVKKYRAYFERQGETGILDVGKAADRFLTANVRRYAFDPIFHDRGRYIAFYKALLGLDAADKI